MSQRETLANVSVSPSFGVYRTVPHYRIDIRRSLLDIVLLYLQLVKRAAHNIMRVFYIHGSKRAVFRTVRLRNRSVTDNFA